MPPSTTKSSSASAAKNTAPAAKNTAVTKNTAPAAKNTAAAKKTVPAAKNTTDSKPTQALSQARAPTQAPNSVQAAINAEPTGFQQTFGQSAGKGRNCTTGLFNRQTPCYPSGNPGGRLI